MKNLIILSTYNGSLYLRELLQSILGQNSKEYGIYISDDCSTDNTMEIIREYEANEKILYVSQNRKNLGWRKNFKIGLTSVNCQYVYPCDQDDIWSSDKIKIMTKIMDLNTEIDVLACSVDPIYEKGAKQYNIDKTTLESKNPYRQKLDNNSVFVLRPGCTYCVRKSFIKEIIKYWDDSWAHDATLWRFAAFKGTLYLIDFPLVKFRRHANNASNPTKINRIDRLKILESDLNCYLSIRNFLYENYPSNFDSINFINKIIYWQTERINFLRHNFCSFFHLVKLRNLYPTNKGLWVDCILSFFPFLNI